MKIPKEELSAFYWCLIVGLTIALIFMGLGRAGTFGTPTPPASKTMWLAPGQHLSDLETQPTDASSR